MNTRSAYLGIAFIAASSAAIYSLTNDNSDELSNSFTACTAPLLVPRTPEQAEYLAHHAAEAYGKLKPITQKDLEKAVQILSDGEPYQITGIAKSGTSTLPDGTTKPLPCVTYRLIR